MGKTIIYGDEARNIILKGAKAVYEAIKTTYGPKGGNVAINRDYGPPIMTHDGVTVASSIDFDNEGDTFGFSVGSEMIKDAAKNLNKTGDGTTSVSILAYHILEKSIELINSGYNQMILRKDIESLLPEIMSYVDKLKLDFTPTALLEIATISAEDKEIGKIVSEVVATVGSDGVINIEDSNNEKTFYEISEGYTFDNGYLSPLFITNPDKQEAYYEDVDILIIDEAFEKPDELFKFLKKYTESGRDKLLIICSDVKKEALAGLVYNKMKDMLSVVAVKSPGFGDFRTELLSDISELTGSTIVMKGDIAKSGLEVLGKAKKVIAKRDKTTIISGADESFIEKMTATLKHQLEFATDKFSEKRIKDRIAMISSKVGVVRVGGENESVVEEKRFRIEDAVSATKAALSDGIVPGGGSTFLALSRMDRLDSMGWQIISESLKQLPIQLINNSGYDGESEVEKLKEYGQCLNVITGKRVRSYTAGIIDPALVIKEVISNAITIACLGMTTNAIVIDKPNKALDNIN